MLRHDTMTANPTNEGAMPAFWNPNSLHYVIDWSAWATLVVGIAAVIGAVVIGQRQADIAARQADIAAKQADIMDRQSHIAEREAETERTRLRAELYDRRVIIFSGIEQYLNEARSNDGQVTHEITERLYQSMSVAPFILGDDAEKLCRSILNKTASLRVEMRTLNAELDISKRDDIVDQVMSINYELDDLNKDLRSAKELYLNLRYVDDI
jgi:multidrug efflux pump subunit AcrA (membrane-fusion protein)